MTHAATHHSITTVKRSEGRSSVAHAAYCAGLKMTDERTGLSHSYQRREDVHSVEVIGWRSTDPADLWNAAEAAEKRKDGQPARSSILALPHDLDDAARARIVRGYALHLRDRHNVAVMTAIHRPEKDGEGIEGLNDHVHIIETTRRVESGQLGAKVSEMSDRTQSRKEVQHRRAEWQRRVNAELAKAEKKDGVKRQRVDSSSLASRRLAGKTVRRPAKHDGPAITAMRRKDDSNAKQHDLSVFFGEARTDDGPPPLRSSGDTLADARRATDDAAGQHWMLSRALAREKAREAQEGRKRAEDAERQRKAAQRHEKQSKQITQQAKKRSKRVRDRGFER